MKKFIISLLLLISVAGIGSVTYLVVKGYNYYQDAINEYSLEQMASDLKSNPSYTDIDDMPDIYKDAVVAVEDKRFYKHFGIRPDRHRPRPLA